MLPSAPAPVEEFQVNTCTVSHLSNSILRRDLIAIVAQDRSTTARMLIHLAEFECRGLYREDGYPTMHAYCVGELGMSEDIAYKRTRAARKAREFPRIFLAIADGRLTLSAVVLLAHYLTAETAEDLLAAAERRTNAQVEELLAERFPKPDLPTLVDAIPNPEQLAVRPIVNSSEQLAKCDVAPPVAQVEPRPKVTPLAPQRYALQLTMSQSMRDKLRRAQDLLGHQVSSGDVVQVLDRALDALIQKLEKRKFGATDKPRQGRSSKNPRHIPACVRRAVSARDGEQCTFVGESGHRCEAREMLEFDHICEVARGGQSTAANLRLRCRAHNQYTAEQTYGRDLMRGKREDARRAAVQKERARVAAEEVIPWLTALGIRADHARQASERCLSMPTATLEERVKAALSCFGPRSVCLNRAAPA